MTIKSTADNMSPAMLAAANAVANRTHDHDGEGERALRFTDATVSTLRAMARRNWAVINWATIDGRRQITSATLTVLGERTRVRANTIAEAKRIEAARLAAAAGITAGTPSITGQLDPFAVIAGSTREITIPF
ncbi:MAG: hypothetical protein EPO06_11940 [Burkholderiaceae bacterium]|nr:MAG: hypothetical protein EPO06_11940 [Burkholderiaceae bacterium]